MAASRGADWGPDTRISSETVWTAPKRGGCMPLCKNIKRGYGWAPKSLLAPTDTTITPDDSQMTYSEPYTSFPHTTMHTPAMWGRPDTGLGKWVSSKRCPLLPFNVDYITSLFFAHSVLRLGRARHKRQAKEELFT